MNSEDLGAALPFAVVMAVGIAFIIFPARIIRLWSWFQRKQLKDWYHMSDEEIDSIPRPINKILGTKGSYTQDLQNAIERPEQAKAGITCMILFGATLTLCAGGLLIVAVILRITGMM